MTPSEDSLIKTREIHFCTLHPDPRQAHTAAGYLSDLDGIDEVMAITDAMLKVTYRLPHASLAFVEGILTDRGFHLDNGLILKLKRALFNYTEEIQLANMGCTKDNPNCTAKIFASNYQRRTHGCRDDRPSHWRRYL